MHGAGATPAARIGRGAIVAILLGAGVWGACSRSSPAPQPPGQRYTVRGRIEQLPDPARPAAELMIHHERIEHFVRQDGTLGMNEMTMPFPVAKGVALQGLAVGDPVEFTFQVRWGGSPLYQVTEIRELPAGTTLQLKAEGR